MTNSQTVAQYGVAATIVTFLLASYTKCLYDKSYAPHCHRGAATDWALDEHPASSYTALVGSLAVAGLLRLTKFQDEQDGGRQCSMRIGNAEVGPDRDGGGCEALKIAKELEVTRAKACVVDALDFNEAGR
jgi:hypothetical protein